MLRRSCCWLAPLTLLLGGCEPFIPTEFLDGARKSEALAHFLAVQRSDQMSSGSVTLGEAGSLGRSGRVSIGARATVVDRGTPSVAGTTVSTDGEAPNTFATETSGSLAFSLDAAMSLWRGFSAGETHVLGITLLGSLALLPAAESSDFTVTGGDGMAVGGGFRLGVIEEGPRTPGLAFTTMIRNLPSLSLLTPPLPTDDGDTMTLAMERLAGTVVQWRFAASKQLGNIGIIAGGGADSYEGHGDLVMERSGTPSGPFEAPDRFVGFSRTLMFVGGSYRIGSWTLGAELGRLAGDAASEVGSQFAGQGDWSKTYLSVGVRVGN